MSDTTPPSISPAPAPAGGLAAAAWYCLRVIARREHVAARNLEQRTGVRVFAPRIAAPRATAAPATEALFPGYVFARFGYPQEARHVASTPGVLGLVAFGGPPPAGADDVSARLATEVARAGAVRAEPQFKAGSRVRVMGGCFRGSEGRVLHTASAAARINVLLTLLGQDVQVSVPGDQLQDTADNPGHVPAGLRQSAGQPEPTSR